MDLIEQLQKQARDKRNEAINIARAEYRQTMANIEQLRRGLGIGYQRVSRSKTKPLQDLIAAAMPKQSAWTVNDLVLMIRKRHPLREFNVPSLRTVVPRLEEHGLIRKVGRDAKGCVLWAAVGADVKVSPFAAMPLTEVAESLLRERGPMRLVELVVLMQQSGFRAKHDPRRLMQSLRWAHKRYPGRFEVGEDGRWSVRYYLPSDCDSQ